MAWASDPGRAFVTASRADVKWVSRSTAGAFWPDVMRSARLTRQTVTEVARSGVTFPPGKWRHILTGTVYRGNRTVAAPIGTPAAFVLVGDPVGKRIVTAMKEANLYR